MNEKQIYANRNNAFQHQAHSLFIDTDTNSATFRRWCRDIDQPEFERNYTKKLASRLKHHGAVGEAMIAQLMRCGQLREQINQQTGEVRYVEFNCKSRACARCQRIKQTAMVKAFRQWFPLIAQRDTVDGIFLSVGFPNVVAADFRKSFDTINKRLANLIRSRSWHFPYYALKREFDIEMDAQIHPNIHMLILLFGDKDGSWNEMHEIRWREELVEKLTVNPGSVDVQLVRGQELSAKIENETNVFRYMQKAQNYVDALPTSGDVSESYFEDTPPSDDELAQCTGNLYLQTHRFRRVSVSYKLNSLRKGLMAGDDVAVELSVRWSPSTRSERKTQRFGR